MACLHGASNSQRAKLALRRLANDNAFFDEVAEDDDLAKKTQVEQKAGKRMQKTLSRVSKDHQEAKKIIVQELHGRAARDLFRDGFSMHSEGYASATEKCFMAIELQRLGCRGTLGPSLSGLIGLYEMDELIMSPQGIVLYLAKRIPCHCLDQKKREIKKKEVKIGWCRGCGKTPPVSEMLVCSSCRVESYCSQVCQRSLWKEHKDICPVVRAEAEAEGKVRLEKAKQKKIGGQQGKTKSSNRGGNGCLPAVR